MKHTEKDNLPIYILYERTAYGTIIGWCWKWFSVMQIYLDASRKDRTEIHVWLYNNFAVFCIYINFKCQKYYLLILSSTDQGIWLNSLYTINFS